MAMNVIKGTRRLLLKNPENLDADKNEPQYQQMPDHGQSCDEGGDKRVYAAVCYCDSFATSKLAVYMYTVKTTACGRPNILSGYRNALSRQYLH